MDSIIQKHKDSCYLCGLPGRYDDPLDRHHIFFGKNRKLSEQYGLTVYLHHNSCHIFGKYAVHQNGNNDKLLKSTAQRIAMVKYGWSVEDFIDIFGKSYQYEVKSNDETDGTGA